MSSTSRRMQRNVASDLRRLGCTAAMLVATSVFAHAQGLNIPGANSGPPPVLGQQAPQESVPAASAPIVSAQPVAMPVPTAAGPAPAPVPAAPPSQLRPPVAAVPPMPAGTLSRAVDKQMDAGAAEAARRLGASMPEGLTPADAGAIGNELEDMAERQRRIRRLKLLNMEADELAKLNKTINSDGGMAPAGQQAQKPGMVSEQEVQRRVEQAKQEAAAQAKAEAEAAKKRDEDNAPRPVVASIFGSAKSGRQAIVLIPYVGELTVRVGSKLPDGMRVVEISEKGVEVSHKGERYHLGFGESVPRTRPPERLTSAAPQQPGVTTYTQPILAGPLPVSAGARMPGR
jgi:type IV pilus biogenesis protein PilP